MLGSDDPRSYRHHTNAHPGQSNSPLDVPSGCWGASRIRLVRGAICTYVIPEVYIESGDKIVDRATGVPRSSGEGSWMQLYDRRTGRPIQAVVLTGLPGGRGRLQRAINVWKALFHARALIPALVEEPAPPEAA